MYCMFFALLSLTYVYLHYTSSIIYNAYPMFQLVRTFMRVAIIAKLLTLFTWIPSIYTKASKVCVPSIYTKFLHIIHSQL